MTFAQTPFHNIAYNKIRCAAIFITRCIAVRTFACVALRAKQYVATYLFYIGVLFTLLYPMGAMGQTFGWSWIKACGQKGEGQQWFRRTYTHLGSVHDATLRVATTGYVKVYVNGRQVTTDLITPFRPTNSNEAVALTYHVAPFLRPDSVHIAVWYAPVPQAADSCQLAVNFFGEDVDGQRFGFQSDDTWLCRPAPAWYEADGDVVVEGYDGRAMQPEWTFGDTDWALWQPAKVVNDAKCRLVDEANSRERLRLKRVYVASLCKSTSADNQYLTANNQFLCANNLPLNASNQPSGVSNLTSNQPLSANNQPSNISVLANNLASNQCNKIICRRVKAGNERVTAVFPQPFFGFVRITFRGARRGERVATDNGLAYICSNQIDEQLFGRFLPRVQNIFSILGDRRFQASQVLYVEGLELSSYLLLPWMNF